MGRKRVVYEDERTIMEVGNSYAVTLPKWAVQKGQKVKIKVYNDKIIMKPVEESK